MILIINPPFIPLYLIRETHYRSTPTFTSCTSAFEPDGDMIGNEQSLAIPFWFAWQGTDFFV